jgi:multiple sugar transport system substrate-binding protein
MRLLIAIAAAVVVLIVALLVLHGRQAAPPAGGSPAGSAAQPQQHIVFAAGGAPSELAEWKQLLADFSAAHPQVKVELRELPADSDQQHSYYTTLLGGGSGDVDVMRLDVAWLPEFHAAGWLAPLDSALGAGLLPFAQSVDVYGGQWYGVPWNLDVGVLYYRKDLLDRAGLPPPATWQALRDDIAAVRQLDGAPPEGYLWQGKQYEGLSCNYLEQVVSRGGSLDPRQPLNADAHRAALRYMRGLVADGLSPRDTGSAMDEERCRELFQRGDAVFMRNWPYAWALLNAKDSPVAGKVGLAPLPAGPGGQPAGALGGWQLGVAAHAAHPQAAAELVQYLTSPAVQLRLARELNWLPTRTAVWDDPQLAQDAPAVALLHSPALSATARPALPDYPQLSLAVQQAVNKALTGLATPEAAWAELRPKLEQPAP